MITILNFSERTNGNCSQISQLVYEHYKKADVVIENINLNTVRPCGNCNYECFKKEMECPIQDSNMKIYNRIIESNLVIFVVPNYCDYPNSNYFAFNERACGFFKDKNLLEKYFNVIKKFIVISNTNTENFIHAFKYQGNENPDVLFLSARKFGLVSLDGNLVSNPTVKQIVDSYLDNSYQMEESAMAVVLCNNKILTINESVYERKVLSLPKGHIEYKENPIETAIRECFEETNVVITKEDFIREGRPYKYRFMDQNFKLVEKTIYPSLFIVSNQGNPKSKEERISEVSFMDLWKFMKDCSYENVKDIVMQIIE